jgi:uncharacterized protein (TIGR03435 family)
VKPIVLALAAVALWAQSFESVTVKPFVPQDDYSETPAREPGSMVYSNVSLKLLLAAAYSVRPEQIDGPAWLDSDRYDIVAKPPAGATKDQVPLMLQNLLADRFHATVREEIRPRISYALVVGKDGAKLKPTKAITGVDFAVANDHVDISGANLPAFASMLASYIGHPVADETGIRGSYDFRLNATMADLKSASAVLFTAIQDLGLTLEPRTTSAKYLLVTAERQFSPAN